MTIELAQFMGFIEDFSRSADLGRPWRLDNTTGTSRGILAICLAVLAFHTESIGQVVIPGENVLAFPSPGRIGLSAAYGVDHGESAPCYHSTGCYAYAEFAYDGNSLTYSDEAPDLSDHGDWYVVSHGDIFSESTADSFPPVYLAFPNNFPPQPIVVGNSDFYLGVRTTGGRRTAYGWVHLAPVDGMLTMLDNVMSYGSPGIMVGTTTVVPEPATGSLLAVGVLASLTHRFHRT